MSIERTICPLRPRELEVVRWLANGKTVAQIADILGIRPTTVGNYIDRAKDVTGTCKATSLAVRAVREGWIE